LPSCTWRAAARSKGSISYELASGRTDPASPTDQSSPDGKREGNLRHEADLVENEKGSRNAHPWMEPYGAPWLQPAAINGKSTSLANGESSVTELEVAPKLAYDLPTTPRLGGCR
jgi:hypothetical protein